MAAGTFTCVSCNFYRKGESLEVTHMCLGGPLNKITPIVEHLPLSMYYACKTEHVVAAFHKWSNGEGIMLGEKIMTYNLGYAFETNNAAHPLLFHEEGAEKVVAIGLFEDMHFFGGVKMSLPCFRRFVSLEIEDIPSMD